MIERLAIVFLLGLAIIAGWGLLRVWRVMKLRQLRIVSPLTAIVAPGRPTIVAFSTPMCAECRTRQAPALARLTAQLGESVVVRSLSALEHPDLVSHLGILTVPATVVLDAAGTIRHLNLGYVSDARLREQIGTA